MQRKFPKNAFVASCLLKHESLLLCAYVQFGDQYSLGLRDFSFSLDPDDNMSEMFQVLKCCSWKLLLPSTVTLAMFFFFYCADI